MLAGLVAAAVIIIGGAAFFAYQGGISSTATSTSPAAGSLNGTVVSTSTTAAPSAPTAATGGVISVYKSIALVMGQVVPSGAQTSYWYEYGTTDTLGTKTTSQTIGSGYVPVQTPAVIRGLTANTQYYFRLSAKNALGTSNGSINTFTTNTTPDPVGAIPDVTLKTVTGISRTEATVAGRVTPHNVGTTYWFEYGTTPELGSLTIAASAGNGATAQDVSAALSGLDPLTKYYFRLDAQNGYGTVATPVTSFTTSGPAAMLPPTVSTQNAVSVASTTATLHGQVDPKGSLTTYWFEYSADANLNPVTLRSTPQVAVAASAKESLVQVEIAGLSGSTKYYFRVVANNNAGTTRGDPMSFITK